jgi:hypothetical protein
MQVDGAKGMANLMTKFRAGGPAVFFHGAMGASSATFAGHYPWFFTYNSLSASIPVPETTMGQLGRNAFLGFSSSLVSDTVSNSLRVVKTYKQTNERHVTYPQAVNEIVAKDGTITRVSLFVSVCVCLCVCGARALRLDHVRIVPRDAIDPHHHHARLRRSLRTRLADAYLGEWYAGHHVQCAVEVFREEIGSISKASES